MEWSYITSYAYSHADPKELKGNPEFGPSSSSRGGWVFSDPEFQRKHRVAGYKARARSRAPCAGASAGSRTSTSKWSTAGSRDFSLPFHQVMDRNIAYHRNSIV